MQRSGYTQGQTGGPRRAQQRGGSKKEPNGILRVQTSVFEIHKLTGWAEPQTG